MPFTTARSLFRTAALAVPLIASPLLPAQRMAGVNPAELPDAPTPALTLPTPPPSPEADAPATPNLQTSTSTAQGPTPAQPPLTEEEKRKLAEAQLQQELHQRMAGVVPNFNAVLYGTALPLSPGQKMRAAFRSAIDPYQFGLAFIISGYGQATDSHESFDANGTHHGYEQGWAGFGQRYGANYIDQFDGTIIGNGILPVLLHQDARYYRMGTGSFKKRFFYSLSTTVICRGDNRKKQPNYSNVLGNIASGGISNLYYPKAERGFGLTIEQGLEVTAEGSFGALLIEFYPDIRRHIHGKRRPDPTLQNPAP